MKPVIKKETHYNLVLMRDDTQPRTMRLSDTTLRAGIFFLVFLILFCLAGIAGGVYYWQKYRLLQQKHASLERETGEMRLQLERLVALETLISASNGALPHAPIRHQEVGVPTPPPPASLEDMEGRGKEEGETREAVKSNAVDRGTAPAPSGDGPGSGGTGPESKAAPQSAAKKDALLRVEEDSPLRITGFAARQASPQALRIGYELVVADPGDETHSGSVEYFAILENGTRQAMPMLEGPARRFSIGRRKRIQASTRLPDPYTVNDVKEVDVLVLMDDGSRYHQIFAVK